MLRLYIRITILLGLLPIAIFTAIPVKADLNKFLAGRLNIATPTIYNAKDYRVDILASALPSTSNWDRDFTTGWLSIHHKDPSSDPELGFIQVGLLTQPTGLYWFAFSFEGITCLEGEVYWRDSNNQPLGCRGTAHVALSTWHTVELAKYDALDYWIARVYDSGGTATDVARFPVAAGQGNRVYRVEVDFEQGINFLDYTMEGYFYFRNPKYGQGAGTSWPLSGTSASTWNYIYEAALQLGASITPRHCDDIYGITLYDRWNPWGWYAGTGGQNCGHIFPPIAYDDANGAMAYTGSWTYNDTCCLKAWKGTLHWTNGTNNKVNLNNVVPANSITRVYTKAPNRGNSRVKIGPSTYTFDDNDSVKLWQVAKTWSVSGSTNVEIANNCCNYIDVDAILIDTPRIGAGTYENKHHLIRYLGAYWTHKSQGLPSNPGPSGQTLSWSNEPESAVTFTFTGSKITYYYSKAYNRGIARVTIDGVFKMDINACSSTTQWSQSQEFSNLGSGVHTIHIANTGTTTCKPSGQPIEPYRYIDVDKLVVAN